MEQVTKRQYEVELCNVGVFWGLTACLDFQKKEILYNEFDMVLISIHTCIERYYLSPQLGALGRNIER